MVLLCQRQRQFEDRAAGWRIFRAQLAAMGHRNLLRDPQPEPAALGLGGEIGVKDQSQVLGGNSRPGIRNAQADGLDYATYQRRARLLPIRTTSVGWNSDVSYTPRTSDQDRTAARSRARDRVYTRHAVHLLKSNHN